MLINVKNFGTVLVSRPAGKEAYLSLQSLIKDLSENENLEIDFEGVSVLTPSWADEFITPLQDTYKNRILLLNTENPSVKASLKTLEKAKASL